MYCTMQQVKNLEEYITANSSMKYALYGTGKISAEIISIFARDGIRMPVFVVDHMEYAGSVFCGIPFKNLHSLTADECACIVLASNLYQAEMRRNAESLDFHPAIYSLPEPAKTVSGSGNAVEHIAESEHFLILSKIFALSECVPAYFIFGCSAYAEELIELIRFHKLKMPEAFIASKKMSGSIAGIRVENAEILNVYQDAPVVLAGHQNANSIRDRLFMLLKRYHPYVDIFTDSKLKYSYYNYVEIPFLANARIVAGVTGFCNASCIYCPKHSPVGNKNAFRRKEWDSGESMDIVKYAEVVKEFRGHVSRVDIAGIGEPLLYKDIVEFVRLTSEAVGSVGLISNGMMLDEKISMALAAAGLSSLVVSLDSIDNGLNWELRHTDADKIISNLEFFSKNTGIPVQINAAGTNLNFDSLKRFPELKARVPSMATVCIGSLMVYPHLNDALTARKLTPLTLSQIYELDQSIKGKYAENGINLYLEDKFMPRKRFYGDICSLPWGDPTSDFMAYSIECNGDLRLCQGFFYLDNIFELGFLNAINGPKIKQMRKDFLGGKYPDVCKCICGY